MNMTEHITCIKNSCDRKAITRGLCSAHYMRLYRGDGSNEKPLNFKNHGHKSSPEYHSWNMMRARCNIPGTTGFEYYGGRGIKVCKRWDSFLNFLEDMGNKPEQKYTIDRLDNDGDYSKDNCKWSTRTEQSRNRLYVKLSMEKAKDIRYKYNTGLTMRVIASEYNVGLSTIRSVIRGLTWKQV